MGSSVNVTFDDVAGVFKGVVDARDIRGRAIWVLEDHASRLVDGDPAGFFWVERWHLEISLAVNGAGGSIFGQIQWGFNFG